MTQAFLDHKGKKLKLIDVAYGLCKTLMWPLSVIFYNILVLQSWSIRSFSGFTIWRSTWGLVDLQFKFTTSPWGIQFGQFYIEQFYVHGPKGALKGLIREWDEKEILCYDAHESAQKSLPLLLCFTIQSKKNTILRLRTSRIRSGICQVNKGLGVNLLFQTFRLTNIYRTMPQSPERVRIKISKHIL